MKTNQVEIELEIDSILLQKIEAIAQRQGISPEIYILQVVQRYLEKQKIPPG